MKSFSWHVPHISIAIFFLTVLVNAASAQGLGMKPIESSVAVSDRTFVITGIMGAFPYNRAAYFAPNNYGYLASGKSGDYKVVPFVWRMTRHNGVCWNANGRHRYCAQIEFLKAQKNFSGDRFNLKTRRADPSLSNYLN